MHQIVRQTWQERYDMYMRDSKENLASMLAERDKITFPDGCAEYDHAYTKPEIKMYTTDDFKDECSKCSYNILNKDSSIKCFYDKVDKDGDGHCDKFKNIFEQQ